MRYLLSDQQGSIRAVVDAGGGTVASYRYDPFGARTAVTGSPDATPFGYAGQYTDQETGFQYLRARYYDPATAQFLTRDPLVGMTGQPYAYAGNNPLTFADPSGMCLPLCLPLLIIAAGALLGGGAAAVNDQVQYGHVNVGDVAGGALTAGLITALSEATGGIGGIGGLALRGGIYGSSFAAGGETSSYLDRGQGLSGPQLAAEFGSGAILGVTAGVARPLALGILGDGANSLALGALRGGINAGSLVAGQGAADLIDPAHSSGWGGLLLAAGVGFAGGALPVRGTQTLGVVGTASLDAAPLVTDTAASVLSKLDQVTRDRVTRYADLINTDRPWTWNDVGANIGRANRRMIKSYAQEAGLIPTVPVDIQTQFADFTGHVLQEDQLP